MTRLATLLAEVRACTACAASLPLGPRPVLQMHGMARILLIGQAPGRKVHASGVPFDDASGERLRAWLDVPASVFYDARRFAILPMGFCYPGTGSAGDLPPRPECAPLWRAGLLSHLKRVRLTLFVGQYALRHHLPDEAGSLTDIVAGWRRHVPSAFPLPHPSPRNNLWLRRNPWFEQDCVPALQQRVRDALAD